MFLDSFEPRPLAGATLLELWSSGAATNAPERARTILCAAYPREVDERLDALPLGEWNAALLRVRRLQFGETFVLIDRCPHCEEPVELRLSADSLQPSLPAHLEPTPRELATAGLTLHYRLLTGSDWRAAMADHAAAPAEAGVRLLRRSVLKAIRGAESISLDEISNEAWEVLAGALAEADPWSEILFQLRCPRCERGWDSLLEPGDYVWHEIAGLAQQSLRQVHRLASAYGWTESVILDLPADRRAAYIALLDDELGWASDSLNSRLTAARAP